MKGQQKWLRRPHGMLQTQPAGVIDVLEGIEEVLDKGKDEGEVGESQSAHAISYRVVKSVGQ